MLAVNIRSAEKVWSLKIERETRDIVREKFLHESRTILEGANTLVPVSGVFVHVDNSRGYL